MLASVAGRGITGSQGNRGQAAQPPEPTELQYFLNSRRIRDYFLPLWGHKATGTVLFGFPVPGESAQH